MKKKAVTPDYSGAISRGAKKAQKAIRELTEDYDARWKNVVVFRRKPRNHEESFRLYGECRVPGCDCPERPTFSRHRF